MIKPQPNSSYEVTDIEHIFYDYFREYLIYNTAEETILEFSCIFIEGRSQNALIRDTIENLLHSKINTEDFNQILHNCFYIVIDYWLEDKEDREYIIQLIELFEIIDYQAQSYSRRKHKILSLTQEYTNSKYYAKLKRIATVFDYKFSLKITDELLVHSCLSRYTYLYQFLLKEQNSENNSAIDLLIQELKINYQKAFELRLSQHIIYRTRLIEIAKARQFSHGAGKIIRRIPNPTLLSDKDLRLLLKQYIKKIDCQASLYQLARNFIVKTKRGTSYREFKQDLYYYLIYQIEPKNIKYNLSRELWSIIDKIYYQSDTLILTESLILRTCRKLYQLLIINNSEKHQHQLLLRLIKNLGTAQTGMLLIKIVLICPQAKPDLERRLANLFIYYESETIQKAPWIVKFLEQFLVAFSIYFGKIDLSLAKVM